MLIRVLLCSLCLFSAAAAADRPNFVFIVSEDNSKHYLKLFDEAGAQTPNIARLAEGGLIFERAFSNSPVCSVARTTLATGVYAPRMGTQFHRKSRSIQMPDGWRLFHEYLREAGYYVANNSKTDYNVAVNAKHSWHESSSKASWRQRPSDETPFFYMQSLGVSHEGSLHFHRGTFENKSKRMNLKDVKVWPYFPDTELFRFTTMYYHNCIQGADGGVGSIVDKLREDGLLDKTFVFYFGDHGGVLPGSKGYAWERGLHVPLVIHVPEKFRHLVNGTMKPGLRVDGFVEFVDFGPTVLRLAGLEVPDHMDGRPFLGKKVTLDQVNARDETFGYADRFDEKYEFVRALRKGQWKYMRFFQGYYPDGMQNNYRYKMLAYQQWREMHEAGELNAAQDQFYQPKPAEGLYNLVADPHELDNLADDPAHAAKLAEMRRLLQERMRSMPDLSYYPETVIVEQAAADPIKFAETHREEIERMADIAQLGTKPFAEARDGLMRAIESDRELDRYWAMMVCATFGEQARPLVDKGRRLLEDANPLVQTRAAEFCGRLKVGDPDATLMHVLATADSPTTAGIALNAVVYLRDVCGYPMKVSKNDVKARGGYVGRRLQYLSATE